MADKMEDLAVCSGHGDEDIRERSYGRGLHRISQFQCKADDHECDCEFCEGGTL